MVKNKKQGGKKCNFDNGTAVQRWCIVTNNASLMQPSFKNKLQAKSTMHTLMVWGPCDEEGERKLMYAKEGGLRHSWFS